MLFHSILRSYARVCLDAKESDSEEDKSTWSLKSEEITPPDSDFAPPQMLVELHELMSSALTLDEEWRQTGRWVCGMYKSTSMKVFVGNL